MHRSALVSGLTLVPWGAAFGLARQLVRRLPRHLAARAPIAGNLGVTAAYAAISGVSFAGDQGEAVLLSLMTVGGFALGTQFSSMLAHITNLVATEYAAELLAVLVARLAVYAGSSTEITRPRRPSRNCTTPARAA